jgi:predicted DNA-binding transcriptional regulator YafY
MLETSARLLRLLSLLQGRRDWSGPELAERLGVTTRTIRNDIDRLRRLGYPVDAAPGATGGYRLAIGAVVPPLLLDDEEAVAVAVGLRSGAGGAVSGLEEASVRALVKVQQLLPAHLRDRVEALTMATVAVESGGSATSVDPTLLATVAATCRDHVRLVFDYLDFSGRSSRRDVEPHRLVHGGRRWYLLAWDTGRRDWRTFRLDRVTLPANHRGPRFVPRSMPPRQAADRVREGVRSATWSYRAEVIVHAPADRLVARLPAAAVVEAIDERTSRVQLGASTPETLAVYLGLFEVDIEVDAAAHPELADAFAHLADRYRRAVAPAP